MLLNMDQTLMHIARDAVEIMRAVQKPTELAALLVLLRDINVKNFLEIGSEAGGTFYAFCQVSDKGGKKISLDLPSGATGSGRFVDGAAYEERRQLLSSFAENVYCINGDSHESLGEVQYVLQGELLDFLFIDGDHTYAGVKKDWEMYSLLVRPGGIVAFHDIMDSDYHRRRGVYVTEFWKELQGSKAEIITGEPHWGGIGVVFV